MAGTVVIKWGGGLITHKDKLCTINQTVIDALADVCKNSSKRLVIVHGAGSFGHMKAKQFRLAEGRVEGFNQDGAVSEVRNDMLELNQKVVSSLESRGLDVRSFPPHKWAKGTGPNFSGELPIHDGVTVVYGDVVDDDFSVGTSPGGEEYFGLGGANFGASPVTKGETAAAAAPKELCTAFLPSIINGGVVTSWSIATAD